MITSLVTPVLTFPQGGAPRSEGVHVSRVIKKIAADAKILKPEWIEDLSLVEVRDNDAWWAGLDDASRLRMSIGMAWEDWYVPNLSGVAYHPGEMCLDGIYMTHDGESLDVIVGEHGPQHTVCVHEVKATYKSTKTVGDLETQWLWLAQTKAYCKGLGTRIAYLHVLFLCGDYSFPIRPQLKVWQIEYTQEEIDDNWDLIRLTVKQQQEAM